MTYRSLRVAPAAAVDEARRGPVKGRFCRACGGVFSLHADRHKGKPVYGKDHIAAPCAHEGDAFDSGEAWWEPAVEVLPAPPSEG